MTTKRKPTLKQLFTAWSKYEKKSDEVRNEKYRLEQLARDTPEGTELISDGKNIYRVTVRKSYSYPYTIERIANADELSSLK